MPGGRPRKQAAVPVAETKRRARGTGTLRIDKRTGRVYALDVRDANGHRESYEGKGLTFELRIRDAEGWLDGRLAARARAAGLLPETVGEYLVRWRDRRYRTRPFTTIANITTRINRAAPIHNLLVPDVRAEDIEKLVVGMVDEGLAARYIRLILGTLKSAFRAAIAEGLLAADPVGGIARTLRIPVRRQVVWERDAARLFLDEARVSPWWPMWLLAVAYGLRQGELRALQWPDLDLRRCRITVRRGLRRGRREGDTKTHVERVIPILPEIAAELRAFRASPWTTPTWVFSHRPPLAMTPDAIASELTLLIARINASYPPEDGDPERLADLTPHGLRHTAATLMLRRGVPVVKVSQILGHTKPSITWDMYGWAVASDDDLVDQSVRDNYF